ncbi:hypothetical protein [Roseococcus thiosulfatophilus]|uniref:hypothetical protein n=1 Tax=Roseococcus thiosulfatophilus TaxID=35813 RepID=UPI001A8D9CDB|nr:hypothetical protein [Roseococcus thiosulfatophilus]
MLPAFNSAQTTAWLMAHRALLAFLYRELMARNPAEAAALDATATMLRNSMAQFFAHLPEAARLQMVELAGMEIDRILLAPDRDATPPDSPA